jgi:hypothetical protein
MKTRYHTMTKRSVSLFLIVSLLLAASLACGFITGGPTPTPTPVPPTATSTPIPPTSTPTSIPGIDKPIVVEDVTVKDFLGNTWTGDIHLRLLNAYTQDSLDSQSETNSPRDPDNIFLILELELSGQSGSLEWTANNASLTCGKDQHKVDRFGLEVGEDGKLKAWRLIFEVPQDSDFRQCVFHLKEHDVELARFFK